MQSIWAPFPFAVLSFLAVLPMKHAGLEDPPSFVPATHIVVAYAIPFAFGWLLFANTDLLDTLRRRAWLYAVIGAVMGIVYLGADLLCRRSRYAVLRDSCGARALHVVSHFRHHRAVPAPFCGTQRAWAPTFVGALLNGRRYPGAFTPAVAAAD
jgi:hypothetical protein